MNSRIMPSAAMALLTLTRDPGDRRAVRGCRPGAGRHHLGSFVAGGLPRATSRRASPRVEFGRPAAAKLANHEVKTDETVLKPSSN